MEAFDFEAVFDVDDYLYFYGELLTDERTDAEVNALVSLLGLSKPAKILDLACGFGRHTNRLAALGHCMTGVDLMPGFLDLARNDAVKRNVDVRYVQGDMRDIKLGEPYDDVTLLFTAFGYFSDEENLQVLVNVKNTLKIGGLLVFDTLNRDTIMRDLRRHSVMEKEGNLMIDRMTFDCLQGRLYNKRIVIRDGVRKDKPNFVRLYNLQETRTLLAQAGLELEHVYGSFDGTNFSSDSHRMVVLARRP